MIRASVTVTRTWHVEAESEAEVRHVARGLELNPGITESMTDSRTVKVVNTISDYLMLTEKK